MNKKLTDYRQILQFVVFLIVFAFVGIYKGHAQSSGITISWDKEVGCQTYDFEKEREVFIEDIGTSDCIRVCEFSAVTYTLANLPAGATTSWNVVGGNISSPTNSSCMVTWGAVGSGSLSFTITNGNSITSKTLCFEKILIPTALFEVAPLGQSQPVYTCTNQSINFINLSTTNNGTNLVSYYWDFGDGTTSTAFEPSHTYTYDDNFVVELTVRNECNCIDKYKIEVSTKGKGFEISCPTVICEGQSAIYSLPFDGMEICNGNFNWSVVGGHILSQGGGNIEVLWDDVDDSGFGYVTFDPSDCSLDCLEPTTIKVPVIKTKGTIQGPTDLCLGEQGRYSLPQWPTTDIHWEILGNVGNNIASIIQTDQRNEVIVTPINFSGVLTLRATYTNTLLHCSGEAEFQINVAKPLEIYGEEVFCQSSQQSFGNVDGVSVNWTLTQTNGTIVTTQNNTPTFTYTFNQAGNFLLSANAPGYCNGEQKTITVVGKPTTPTGIDGDVEVCPNSPYTYAVQNPDATSNYYWEVTNGTIIGSDLGDEVNITFNGTFPALVKVYKKTISPVECTSDPYTITVNQIPIDAAIVSDTSFALCANSVASYEAVIPGTATLFDNGDTYTWSFANSSSSITASSLGSVTNGQGTNAVDITWNNVTTVTTVDLVLTIGKCNISPAPQFVQQITLYPKTEIEIVASSNPVCAGGLYPVTFTVQSANGVPLTPSDVVTWNFGSGNITTAPGQFTYTTTLNNNSTVNIGQVVTAFIANANNCGQTNTFSYTITVLPNPPAIATLTSPANAFCNAADVDATITVSSNTTGVTFQWFQNGSAIGQTGTSLHVTAAMGPGAYTFQATNPNGCISVSNPIYINVVSCSPIQCTIAETLQNNSYLSACGQITFSGTASGTPINEVWQVLGPDPLDYSISGNILTGKPGNYKIVYKVYYPCQEGGTGYKVSIKDVVIPYEPDFSYVVECAGNNSFNVNFIDNSNFYAQVTNPQINFYYKLAGAASFTGPVAYDPSLSVYELSGISAGNYIFKLEISGTQANTPTYVCTKEFTVNLQGINPFISIIVNNGETIKCHNTAVKFELSIQPPNGTTVLWNFDDDGATNTMNAPTRVFNTPDTTYNVTCTVTNQFGCSLVIPIQVYIPKECFFGDVVANPANATVCKNETVTLSYVPNGDNCTATSYVWMNGNQVVAGAPNASSITVGTTGFYWVKVISANNCEYASPTQIKPVFHSLPNLKLFGDTSFCEDQDIILNATTNASSIAWFVDNVPYSQFDNITEANFTGVLSAGTYTIKVEATSTEGCVNTATQVITIAEALHDISFDVTYSCDPYEVVIKANPNPYDPSITYNWSNGESTQTIVVSDGGPYRVTATLGGCSLSAEIDIPKNPENYLWIFPTGCYTDCSTELNYLIGPTLPLTEWSWNLDYNPDQTGGSSYASPYTLIKDGLYTFSLNTGECSAESEPLDYSTTRCEKCRIEAVDIKEIVKNDTPYCSYTYNLVIYSAYPYPYQATIMDDLNNVLILPSSFTIQPGVNNLQFTVIPQSPYNGGGSHWTIQGSVPTEYGYEDCIFEMNVDIPSCEGFGNKTVTSKEQKEVTELSKKEMFQMYPNPTRDVVMLHYALISSDATVEIFDLSGRSISKNVLSSSQGEVSLNTSTYQAGIYIVVVKQNDTVLFQQKLIKE